MAVREHEAPLSTGMLLILELNAIALPHKGSDIQTLNSKLSMARGVADVLH